MAVDIDSTTKNASYLDVSAPALAELAVLRGEGQFASNGAIVARTGHRTGRSPKDPALHLRRSIGAKPGRRYPLG